MGLIRWLRGGDGTATPTRAVSAALGGVEEVFSPNRWKAREHLHSMTILREEDGDSDGGPSLPYRIDLDARTATVVRRPEREPDADQPE